MRYLVASVVALFFIAFLIPVTPASAAVTVPTKMNFQGRLTDTAGNVKANGTYNMRFKLYTVSSGGANVWAEDYLVSATQGVTITNGSFSVQLGTITPLSSSLFASGPLYLEVEFPTPATAATASPVWTEGAMTPRNQMLTSAYAYNAETVDGIDGAALAQLSTNNTFTGTNTLQSTGATAFRVQSAGGANTFLTVDTSGGQVSVGNAAADGTAVLFRLDDKNTTGDPTGVAGATYYNSFSGKFRCFQGAAWVDCIGAAGGGGTLQDAYNNSTSPAVITTTAAKGINVTAGAAPTVDMLSVSNAGFANTTAGVNGLSVNYVGGAAAVEAAGVRIDLTPGTTTGGTWSGLRVVSAATGPVTGVTSYGIKLEGPTTPGLGTEVGLGITSGYDIGVDVASGGLQLSAMNEPSNPTTDKLKIYTKLIAGRAMLKAKTPNGISYAYQPSLFQQSIFLATPGNGATANSVTAIGGPVTSTGTISMAATSEAQGVMGNQITGATIGNTAGISNATTQYYRGSVAGGASGYFYMARISLPDALAKYNSTTTGSRLFFGLTDLTMIQQLAADNPTNGNFTGFSFAPVRDSGSGAFQFVTKNGTTPTTASTGVTLAVNKTYDFYIYCPPQSSTVYWRIENLTDGTAGVDGTATATLPTNTVPMRAGIQISTLEAVAHNLRWQRLYVETDR